MPEPRLLINTITTDAIPAAPLPLLKLDEKDSVAVKLVNQKGWTTTTMQHPRSYFILTNDGILCRNRRHLRLLTHLTLSLRTEKKQTL